MKIINEGRVWKGVVIDDEYWKAVEEMENGHKKWGHYLFGGEPMLSILIKNEERRCVKNGERIGHGVGEGNKGDSEVQRGG